MRIKNFSFTFIVVVIGFSLNAFSQDKETDIPIRKYDDRKFFGLRGPVKSISIDGDGEVEADHLVYNFDKDGKIINGNLCGWEFSVDYARNKNGIITIFGVYDGEEDIVDTLLRNYNGDLLKWGYWKGPDENYSETIILSKDSYGNPIKEESKGNDGHNWPDADSGDYIEQTINEYVYDDFGNWISCCSLSERHYLKPQTTSMGEPTDQDETYSYKTLRTITYYEDELNEDNPPKKTSNIDSFGAFIFLDKDREGFKLKPNWEETITKQKFKKYPRREMSQGEGEWPDTYIIEYETPYIYEKGNKKISVIYVEYEQYDVNDMSLNGTDSYIHFQFSDLSDKDKFLKSIYNLGFKQGEYSIDYFYDDDSMDYYKWIIEDDGTIILDHEH